MAAGRRVAARRVTVGLGTVGAGTAAVLGLVWFFQRRLIYLPYYIRPGREFPPAETVLEGGEDVSFDTEDGLRLKGWFVPAGAGREAPTVLAFNGNAADRSFRAPLAAGLSRAGLSVLLFDYRGYGSNPGSPSEQGLVTDARAARAYLASRDDVDPHRVVYFGESLGAAVAVALATEQPPRALIMRSPFPALAEVGRLQYPYLPVRLLLTDRYPVLDEVREVGVPVLVVAGEEDHIVPPDLSRSVYEAAAEPKRMVVIPGAGHDDAALFAGQRFLDEVLQFVAETTDFSAADRSSATD